MGIGIASVMFALLYAIGTEATNYISVYGLGMVDKKFGDAQGNMEISHRLLPLLVCLATGSFVAGIGSHRAWLRQHLRVAVLTGSIVGLGCSAVVLGSIVLEETVLASVAEALVPVNLLILGLLPAVAGHFVCAGFGAPSTARRSAVS